MTRRRGVAMAALVALAALGFGCGVSPQPEANRIAPDQVPFGLLERASTTTLVDEGRPVTIYLLAGESLIEVDRTLSSEGRLAELLELVIAGPNASERELGITSAVPQGTIAQVGTKRGTAEVDLAQSFGELRSGDQVLALAQIVFALTAQPGIGSVSFTLEGEPIEVPRSDGTASDQPLSRDDFSALAPD